MRITDLLDARIIHLYASPNSKREAIAQIVDLMVKSEKINDKEAYRKQVYEEKKKVPQESARELHFNTEIAMQYPNRDWQQW